MAAAAATKGARPPFRRLEEHGLEVVTIGQNEFGLEKLAHVWSSAAR